MKNHPIMKRLTPALVYLNAVIWIGLGLMAALELHPAMPDEPLYRWGMAALSLLTGGAMIALYLLSRRWRLAYFMLVGMFALIALLAFADDFGVVDLAALVINLLAMLALIVNRDNYTRPSRNGQT